MNISRRTIIVWAGGSLAGCAGFRGGWDSAAYVGDAPPADPQRGQPIELPGLTLSIAINNRLRTRDTQVVLFALPMSIDPRRVYSQSPAEGRTRVHIAATPSVAGFEFVPAEAALAFEGRRHRGDAGYVFDRWDEQGRRVTQGGRWDHRRVDAVYALDEPSRQHLLSIDFATPVPDPQRRDIVLELSRALRHPSLPPLPPVRFVPVAWSEGYT